MKVSYSILVSVLPCPVAFRRFWTGVSFLTLFVHCFVTTAQTHSVISAGTPAAAGPDSGPVRGLDPSGSDRAGRFVYLYTASDLSPTGLVNGSMITDMAWIKMNGDSSDFPMHLKIYLRNSNTASFANTTESWLNLVSNASLVFDDNAFLLPADSSPDYINFHFFTPFVYSGGSLEVAVEYVFHAGSGPTSGSPFAWQVKAIADRIYGIVGSDKNALVNLSSTSNSISTIDDQRPDFRLTHYSNSCSASFNAGKAMAMALESNCAGSPVRLYLDSLTPGTGFTFDWQAALNPTGPFTSLGVPSISPDTFVYPLSTTYYRAEIRCGAVLGMSDTVTVVVTGPLAAGTYTIDQNLSSSSTNFTSIGAAVERLTCGISGPVNFDLNGSQVFQEQVIFEKVPGSSSSNKVTFRGHGAGLSYAPTASERYLICLDGAKHLVLDSFHLEGQNSSYGWGIQLKNSSDSNVITNILIDLSAVTSNSSTAGAGIVISDSPTSAAASGNASYNLISGNHIIGGSTGMYYGMRINGSSGGNNCEGNQLINNIIENIYQYNIYLDEAVNTVVAGNDISRALKSTVGNFYGIYLASGSSGNEIYNNRIHHTHDSATTKTRPVYGIYLNAADGKALAPNRIYNNLLHDLNGEGPVYGLYNSGSDFAHYFYNTVSIDDPLTVTTDPATGFYQTVRADSIILINNIFSVTRSGGGIRHAIYLNDSTTEISTDHNVLYVNPGFGSSFYGHLEGSDYHSLKSWQLAGNGNFDLSSDSLNPGFTNSLVGNFTPTSITANGLGIPIPSINTDIQNNTRNTLMPDPGAIEFNLSPVNDSCIHAHTISAGIYSGNTSSATIDVAPACNVGNSNSGGVWYRYVATGDYVNVSLCGSSFDTRLRVYSGTCSSLICVQGNEDYCAQQSQVGFCSEAGVEYFILIHGNGTAAGSFSLELQEYPVIKPVIVPGLRDICPGDSLGLSLSATSVRAIQWNTGRPGDTLSKLFVHKAGTYAVVVTDTNGCADSSSGVQVNTYPVVPPKISVNGSIPVCDGDTIELHSSAGISYLWNDSDMTTNQTLRVTQVGNYTVYVVDSNGCGSYADTVPVKYVPLPEIDLGADTTICEEESFLLDAGSGYGKYNWSTGDTVRQITFQGAAGNYLISVTVEDSNGCEGADDRMIQVENCVGMNEYRVEAELMVYPNPGKGNFKVDCPFDVARIDRVDVYNTYGNSVFPEFNEHGNHTIQFNFKAFPSGFYTARFLVNNRMYTALFMLNK